MSRIEVTRENIVCAVCGAHGHNTGAFGCPFFGQPAPRIYNSRCSRCNQPGHNRSNSRLCSLYDQYPDYCYLTNDDIVVRRRPTVLREYVSHESPEPPAVRLLPTSQPEVLPIRQPEVPPEPTSQPEVLPIRQTEVPPEPTTSQPEVLPIRQPEVPSEPAPVVRSDVIERITNQHRITGRLIYTISQDAPTNKIYNQASQWFILGKLINQTDMSQLTDVELTKHETYVNSFHKLIVDYGFVRPKRNITVIHVWKICEPSSECCVCLIDTDYTKYCEFNCKHNVCTDCVCTMIIKGRHTIEVPIKCPLCRSNTTSITCFTKEKTHLISETL